MLKGFEVQHQPDAFIGNWFHIRNIADNIDTRRIEVRHILFDVPFPWKEGTVKIRLPPGAGIKDGFLKGKSRNGPLHIVDDRFSQSSRLSFIGFSNT